MVAKRKTPHHPHTPPWFAELAARNPRQAAHTRILIALAGRQDICSVCGDRPSAVYALESEPETTARLCADCREIQEAMYGERFVPLCEARSGRDGGT